MFASAVLLYGMSLLYGATGSTLLTDIGAALADGDLIGLEVVAIVFVIAGFAFKVSAVPFHTWAPDTYEGAPTPVTAYLSVSAKAAGFVALIAMIFIAFPSADGVYGPLIWVLSALTMTVGNVIALRQTNIVRMLAYSSVSQGGFILMPLAFVGNEQSAETALRAVVVYLLVYGFTNLGAFAVVIAVARKTRSGEISSYGGLISYAPGLAVLMTVFLASLAGIPPLGGWIAKFNVFKTVLDAGTNPAYVLAVIGAVNTAIAAAYYLARDARDVDERGARRRPHADRHAAADRRRAGDHRRRHARARRAARPRDALRRHRGPHRRAGWLSAAQLRTTSGRRSRTRAGRSRSRGSWSSPCTGRTGSTRRTGQAGRRGDFLTSPEVGPLFGAVVARFLDAEWERLGRPDRRSPSSTPVPAPARSPGRCSPPDRRVPWRCATSPSSSRRRSVNGTRPASSHVEALPAGPIDGVVIANELLDNLPFRLAVHDGAWREAFVDHRRPTARSPRCSPTGSTRCPRFLPARPPHGARAPIQDGCRGGGWNDARSIVRRGRVVAVDYARPTTAEMALLPWRDWLRTYRAHGRGDALPRLTG